jgi:hypothetical protein
MILINVLFNKVTTKTIETIYKSFIRPHLDYCDTIFHEPSKINPLGQSLSTIMKGIERVRDIERNKPIKTLRRIGLGILV